MVFRNFEEYSTKFSDMIPNDLLGIRRRAAAPGQENIKLVGRFSAIMMHIHEHSISDIVNYFEENFEQYYLCVETGETVGLHLQGFVGPYVERGALRKRIYRKFPAYKKHGKSLSCPPVAKIDVYPRYVSKEADARWYSNIYTETEREVLHALWHSKNTLEQHQNITIVTASLAKPKRKPRTVIAKIKARLDDDYVRVTLRDADKEYKDLEDDEANEYIDTYYCRADQATGFDYTQRIFETLMVCYNKDWLGLARKSRKRKAAYKLQRDY